MDAEDQIRGLSNSLGLRLEGTPEQVDSWSSLIDPVEFPIGVLLRRVVALT